MKPFHCSFTTNTTNRNQRAQRGSIVKLPTVCNDFLKTGYLLFLISFLAISANNLIECKNLNSEPDKKNNLNTLMIHNFTIPRNDQTFACIRMKASIYFETKYISSSSNGTFLRHVNFTLNDLNQFKYYGSCSPERNVIEFEFLTDWNLKLFFYHVNNSFVFNHVVLYYKFTEPLYPHAHHNGAQAELYDKIFINASEKNSFACNSGLRVDLGNVVLYIQNLRVQSFFTRRETYEFDKEITCVQDNPEDDRANYYTIWLTVLIVGIIVICFILFIVFRISSDNDARPKKEYTGIK